MLRHLKDHCHMNIPSHNMTLETTAPSRKYPTHWQKSTVFEHLGWRAMKISRINIWNWLPSREQTYPQVKGTFESMIFLFPRWHMLVSWRVLFAYAWLVPKSEVGKDAMTKLDGQMIQVSNFDGAHTYTYIEKKKYIYIFFFIYLS